MLRYFTISLVSILFSLYLFEIYLPFKEKLSKEQLSKEQLLKEKLYETQTGKKWDKRSRLQIYNDLRKVNNKIVIRFQPSYSLKKQNYPIFPLSGISNSDTIHCNENGYFSIYKSDRYGFNNPDEEWDSKEIEYLLIGDSFTHGSCVNRPNDIASVLRTLSNKSTLNLGYGGNGPLIEYATLKEYFNSNIKKVLWIYCESNDLYDLVVERKNESLLKYINSNNYSQNLKDKQDNIDRILKKIFETEINTQLKNRTTKNTQTENDNKLKYKILKFIRLDRTKKIFKKKDTIYEDIIFKEFEKILKLSVDFSRANNSKFIFVYIPEYRRYNSGNYSDENYNKIISIVKKLNIDLIDMKKVFDSETNPKAFFPFEQFAWHYNIEGYKKVAETIYKLTDG
tara:strand:+ start:552 stop:1739 length:1188 start_codon:yes stop_codon:yes gene_type:complete